MRAAVVSLGLIFVAACGAPSLGSGTPVTTLSPPPGAFNDAVTVTFTTDVPAKVFVTTDGTDPTNEKGTRVSGDAPFKLDLTKSTTVTYFSRAGGDEIVHSVQYTRAGGKKGTISGVIVVDTVAVGKGIALQADADQTTFEPLATKGEIPFTIENLATGRHRVQAIADRNEDGNFVPILDLSSDAFTVDLDLGDPFHASAEHVRLFLGASDDGLCSIVGTIKVPNAQLGEIVRMNAISPGAFTGGADPTALLAQLQSGDQIFMQPDQDTYPYAITNLQPGSYLAVPVLTSFGLGGVGLNLFGNPLKSARCEPGKIIHQNFEFGPVAVSGTVTVTPPGPVQGIAYGIVAAKHTTLQDGIQVVLMPVFFLPGAPGATTVQGNYTGHGFKASAQYPVRVFTSFDAQNPIAAALAWAINPFAPEPATVVVNVAQADLTQDISVTPAPPPAP